MSDTPALIEEVLSELDSWPGVHSERRSEELTVVHYQRLELGVLDRAGASAELHFSAAERDELVEHGDAEPASPLGHGENVSHALRGPSDVEAVLELFGRRYRDLRGEDDPRSSDDPA